jgi:hypothetical protein
MGQHTHKNKPAPERSPKPGKNQNLTQRATPMKPLKINEPAPNFSPYGMAVLWHIKSQIAPLFANITQHWLWPKKWNWLNQFWS